MIPLKKAITSSVGKKYVMALTGFGLVVFIILHLAGNLLLLFPEGEKFNTYAHSLESLGNLKTLAQIGLAFVFITHILSALGLAFSARKARPVQYAVTNTKGGPSKNFWYSRNMAITGLVLAVFLVLHLQHFSQGPGVEEGYVTTLHGESVRDLHRLVVESYHSPIMVLFYCSVMLFLGMHLRHGFWSAFQSLGALNKRLTLPIYGLGLLVALIVAIGFFLIPIWIYFDVGAMFR